MPFSSLRLLLSPPRRRSHCWGPHRSSPMSNRAGFLLDPASLDAALETAARTGLAPKGIIPVDLFGQPCAYTEINAYARERGLFAIADAAQSFGAHLDGNPVGTLAEVTATSFFPAKPLGCYGDGGALFTDDDELADKLRSLRVHGKGAHKYDNVRIGINGRLDTIQAAVLLEKLPIFEEEIALRNPGCARIRRTVGGTGRHPGAAGRFYLRLGAIHDTIR